MRIASPRLARSSVKPSLGHRDPAENLLESSGISLSGPCTSACRQHQSTLRRGEFHRPDGMKKDRRPLGALCARYALPLFIPSGRCALFLSAAEWAMQGPVPHPHEVIRLPMTAGVAA
jgi:hypothetical protein